VGPHHTQHFTEPAAEAAFRHYVATLDARQVELRAIDAEIADACSRPPLEVPVARELAGFIWGMMTDRLAVS